MIFLTIGTYPVPFNRLVEAVDLAVGSGLIEEDVYAQIGHSTYKPKHMDYVQMLSKEAYDESIQTASRIIGQAGIGTITVALEHRLPILVMPRLKKYREMVSDHQLDTARMYERLGHVLVAYESDDLPKKLKMLESFTPRERVANPRAVAERIGEFLGGLRR